MCLLVQEQRPSRNYYRHNCPGNKGFSSFLRFSPKDGNGLANDGLTVNHYEIITACRRIIGMGSGHGF
jgi:hypothetical protein